VGRSELGYATLYGAVLYTAGDKLDVNSKRAESDDDQWKQLTYRQGPSASAIHTCHAVKEQPHHGFVQCRYRFENI